MHATVKKYLKIMTVGLLLLKPSHASVTIVLNQSSEKPDELVIQYQELIGKNLSRLIHSYPDLKSLMITDVRIDDISTLITLTEPVKSSIPLIKIPELREKIQKLIDHAEQIINPSYDNMLSANKIINGAPVLLGETNIRLAQEDIDDVHKIVDRIQQCVNCLRQATQIYTGIDIDEVQGQVSQLKRKIKATQECISNQETLKYRNKVVLGFCIVGICVCVAILAYLENKPTKNDRSADSSSTQRMYPTSVLSSYCGTSGPCASNPFARYAAANRYY